MFFSLVDSLATFSNAMILLLNALINTWYMWYHEKINNSLETKIQKMEGNYELQKEITLRIYLWSV